MTISARRASLTFALVVLIWSSATLGQVLAQNGRDQTWHRQSTDHFDIYYQSPERSRVDAIEREAEQRPGSILAHELTHQFLFELLPQAHRDAPWVSEALADHHGGLWDSSELVKLRDALVHGNVPSVEDLTASDRQWGPAVFDFVEAEYGAQGIRRYLAALRGEPTVRRDAIRVAFGVSPHDFDAAFQRYVRTRLGDRQAGPADRR